MICGTTYLYLCCVSDFKNLVSGHNLPTKEMWNILLLELEIKYFPPIFLTQVDNNRHRICEKERKTNKVYCKDSSIASHIIVVANYWATLVQWCEIIFEVGILIFIYIDILILA